VAFIAIKSFISFLHKYGFKVWGIYRILVGVILIALFINQGSAKDNQKEKTECESPATATR
jgi:undecaprenyl-diphosphatase